MKIKKCRLCDSKKLSNLFSLGNLSFTGKFPKSNKSNVPRDYLDLVMCKKCKLVQLDRGFNPNYLYSSDYGYRTGINKTMTKHVELVANEAVKLAKPSKNDFVLDIASNDATLLNFYNKQLNTVGVDPLIKKHKKFIKLKGSDLVLRQIIRSIINDMVIDVILNTKKNLKKQKINSIQDIYNSKSLLVSFSEEMGLFDKSIKSFLKERMYFSKNVLKKTNNGKKIIKVLFQKIKKNPSKFIKKSLYQKNNTDRNICDYIAGMTDRYAINLYNSLK